MEEFLSDFLVGGSDAEIQLSLNNFLSSARGKEIFEQMGADILAHSGSDEEADSEDYETFIQGDYGHNQKDSKSKVPRSSLSIQAQREMYSKERKKQVEEYAQKLPKGVKLLLTEDTVPLRKRSIEITDEMKSYIMDPNEPILKFSEIFDAPEEPRIFPKKKKKMKLDATQHVQPDIDEQEIVHDIDHLSPLVRVTPKTRAEELAQRQTPQFVHDGLQITSDPTTVLDSEAQPMEVEEESAKKASQSEISSDCQYDWTANITWEAPKETVPSSAAEADDEGSDDGFKILSDFTTPAPLAAAAPFLPQTPLAYRPPSYATMRPPPTPGMMPLSSFPMLSTPHLAHSHIIPPPFPGMPAPHLMSPYSGPLGGPLMSGGLPTMGTMGGLYGLPPRPSPQGIPMAPGSNPAFRGLPPPALAPTTASSQKKEASSRFIHKNHSLCDGSWIENIVWDDTDPEETKAKGSVPLLLDMNDSFMNFEKEESSESSSEDSEEVQVQPETRQKSKRRALKLPGRILTGSDLLIKERQAAIRDLDPFNLSSDRWYISKASLQTENTTILHSLPGEKYMATKPPPIKSELRNFHRPRRILPQKIPLALSAERGRIKKGTAVDTIRHQKDISAKDGRVILLEYMEEYPPILADFGMGAKIRNYYRRCDLSDNRTVAFTDGESISLLPDSAVDPSPYFADIPNGRAVQSFENNLYKVPIFHHQPHPTDFLLVRGTKVTPGSNTGSTKFYVREIPALYTAGQILPLREVPAPNSRAANTFMVDRLQACVYWMFKKQAASKGPDAALRIRDVQMAYPGQSEGSIRKRLKHCAEFKRGGDDSGSWVLKNGFKLPTDEETRKITPPDEVVLYECMMAGYQRLQDMGVTAIHNIIQPNTTNADGEESTHKRAVRFIEEELLLTPWNLTSNFVQAMEGKGLLQLSGFGDPSGRGEAFSFLRLPMKHNAGKGQKNENTEIFNFMPSVTGTSADLRKLSLEDARSALLDVGIPEEEIPRGRWERIAMVRKLSSEAKAGGEDSSSIVKFARGSRFSVQHLQEQIDTKLQTIFNNQLTALSANEAPSSDDELDSADDWLLDEIEKDFESEFLEEERKAKKRARPKEDEEEKLAREFMNVANTDTNRERYVQETSRMISLRDDSKPAELAKFSHQPAPGQQYYVKVTRTVMREDGVVQVIELVTDPVKCEQLFEKKKRQMASGKRFAHHLTEEDEQQKISIKKEKRRILEKTRRQKKIQENQQLLQQKYKLGSKDGTLPGGNVTLKCGRCGMFGHMKTNKSCPVFTGDEEEEEQPKEVKPKRERQDKEFL